MKNRYAPIKVGIYDTNIKLTYGRKYAVLHLPYIKWRNNTGNLTFGKRKFDRIADGKQIEYLDNLFIGYDSNPEKLREYLQRNFDW